jgi:hypothetical protein
MFNWIKALFLPHNHNYQIVFSTDHQINHTFSESDGNIKKSAFDSILYKTIPRTYVGIAKFQILLCKCDTYKLRVLAPIGEIPMNLDYIKVMIEIDLKRQTKLNSILDFINKNKK